MNYSTAVMLINDEIRAIGCSYEPDTKDNYGNVQKKQRYTFKTLDKTIKVGDYVVIPTDTRHNLTVAKVEETEVDVDFESDIEIKWAICKVDMDTAKTILAKEQEWVQQLKVVERKHQKEKLREKVLGAYNAPEVEVLSFTGTHDASQLKLADKKEEEKKA